MDKYGYFMSSFFNVGMQKKKKLLLYFGNENKVYNAKETEIKELSFLSDEEKTSFLMHREAFPLEKEWDRFIHSGIKSVAINEENYPKSLVYLSDAPFSLFYLGDLPKKNERLIAMVGARRASEYGRVMSEEIAKHLTKNGFTIVSGMALGIDSASQSAALEAGGRTYAVLGCSVDICYPMSKLTLYNEILDGHGGIISEYPPGTLPQSKNFPPRNRIISGLSEKVLVMEARKRSGSLITADFALEQGRDIYALPGRITDPMSEGTNALIYQGAGIIRSKEELLADLLELNETLTTEESEYLKIKAAENSDKKTKSKKSKKNIPLSDEERTVYDAMDYYPIGIEELSDKTDIPFMNILPVILSLAEKGLIAERFKNEYTKIR